ncbi:MAG: helix-turn-helix domain-containing protein [Candidatus Woesearchaeota archaeon]|jgi:sugar-specific transcriptional regulator TrmB|nr:helix-turn-helix domain-containing protein [Candidatus Woesearchaeota archaeon]MDP7648004.1 helix-turn-helix domain-containing protein [Candidatus Woesearchaeota archaeon]
MDTTLLQHADLTEGESKVYLSLLELGASTTGPIVDRSGVARSIIYQILERLMEKGLASFITKDKTKYYQAAAPTKLLEYMDQRASTLADHRKKVADVIPQLLLKQASAAKSQASVYIGFKGIRTAHEHLYNKLGKGDEWVYLGVPIFQPEEQHAYWKKDHVKRVREGIKFRALFNKGIDLPTLKDRNSYKNGVTRVMDSDIQTPATFLIYADTVTIVLQHPEAIAVEIVNKHIADSFKAYFEEFWKRSK